MVTAAAVMAARERSSVTSEDHHSRECIVRSSVAVRLKQTDYVILASTITQRYAKFCKIPIDI